MSDHSIFDSIMDSLFGIGIPPETLSLDQVTDLMASAGIDPSQLTDLDMRQFLDHFGSDHAAGQPMFGSSTTTPNDTAQFPDGTTVKNPYEDALGNKYIDRASWIEGVNKHVTTPNPSGSVDQASPTT